MPHLVVVPVDDPVMRHLDEELPVCDLQAVAEKRRTHFRQRRDHRVNAQVRSLSLPSGMTTHDTVLSA